MALHLDTNIVPMDKPEISDKQTALYIKCMKNHSASGPDDLKNEMYKAVARITEGMKVLTRCMMAELITNSRTSWMCSKTKMIPKPMCQNRGAKTNGKINVTHHTHRCFI